MVAFTSSATLRSVIGSADSDTVSGTPLSAMTASVSRMEVLPLSEVPASAIRSY